MFRSILALAMIVSVLSLCSVAVEAQDKGKDTTKKVDPKDAKKDAALGGIEISLPALRCQHLPLPSLSYA